jgi:ABC-type multidrug transport system fused ATPase/permease subunit
VSIWQSVKAALALLSKRDKVLLGIAVGIQLSLAFLDLAGVALFGVVAALSASAVTGQPVPLLQRPLEMLGLADVDPVVLTFALAGIAGVLLIVKSILTFLMTRRIFKFLANRQAIISSRLATALLSRPLLFVQRRTSQETVYALTSGVNAATLGVIGNATIIAAEVFLVFVLAAGLAFVDLFLMLFTVAFFALIALGLYKALGGLAQRLGRERAEAEIASFASVQEVLRTYREVTVTGRRGLYVERFQALRWKAAQTMANTEVLGQVNKFAFEIALVVGAALLAISQFLTRDLVGAVSIIAIFLAAASRIMPSLIRLQAAVFGIKGSTGMAVNTWNLARDLDWTAVVDKRSSVMDPDVRARVLLGTAGDHGAFRPEVVVSAVSVTYPGAPAPALDDVSVHVPRGASLALVGATGAGKSTMTDLILGVLKPDSGSVTVNGLVPTEVSEHFPGAIAYVPQDIAVVSGTIRDNVALGLPDEVVRDDLVWEALERAQLAQFLRDQREGLDTVVGEHGMRLSGGQRQRLGLARALYTKPKLIVLDEATSALDAETEKAVAETLQSLGGEVTLVIVAHRLATIRHCDEVVYLEHGRIVARGTFEEVREQAPNFDRQAQLLGL